MLKVVVPVYGRHEDDEENLEDLAEACQNYGRSFKLKGYYECPIKGLNDKNSRLECPFENEKYQYCTEISTEDWRSVLVENLGRRVS